MAKTNDDYRTIKKEKLFSFNKQRQYEKPLVVEFLEYLEVLREELRLDLVGSEKKRLVRAEMEDVLQFQSVLKGNRND